MFRPKQEKYLNSNLSNTVAHVICTKLMLEASQSDLNSPVLPFSKEDTEAICFQIYSYFFLYCIFPNNLQQIIWNKIHSRVANEFSDVRSLWLCCEPEIFHLDLSWSCPKITSMWSNNLERTKWKRLENHTLCAILLVVM